MILLLDTSSPKCKLTIIDGANKHDYIWQADRQLAKGLLGYIKDSLRKLGQTFNDISAIGVFEGPGSFTGIRIGLTVMNTIADAQNIPIVGARGDNWQKIAISKLDEGENEKIVLPYYGHEANITTPRK